MSYRDLLNNEFKRSGSNIKISEIPKNKRITSDSLKTLERKISSQISANDVMRNRSLNSK